jgi:GNAT superfamily N-acetyltransferase
MAFLVHGYRIRRADESDADLLVDLHKDCFDGTAGEPDWPAGAWWIAYTADDEAVGFGGMTPRQRNVGYLSRFGVLPKHRGRGLMRRLVRCCEREARALGWHWLETDFRPAVAPDSGNALIACGYRVFLPRAPWSFSDAVYLRKLITGTTF